VLLLYVLIVISFIEAFQYTVLYLFLFLFIRERESALELTQSMTQSRTCFHMTFSSVFMTQSPK